MYVALMCNVCVPIYLMESHTHTQKLRHITKKKEERWKEVRNTTKQKQTEAQRKRTHGGSGLPENKR